MQSKKCLDYRHEIQIKAVTFKEWALETKMCLFLGGNCFWCNA